MVCVTWHLLCSPAVAWPACCPSLPLRRPDLAVSNRGSNRTSSHLPSYRQASLLHRGQLATCVRERGERERERAVREKRDARTLALPCLAALLHLPLPPLALRLHHTPLLTLLLPPCSSSCSSSAGSSKVSPESLRFLLFGFPLSGSPQCSTNLLICKHRSHLLRLGSAVVLWG
jgi:hypothetical protein